MASEFLSEVKQGMRLRGYALKTETELSRARSCLLPLITFGMSKLTKHHYLNFEAQLISGQKCARMACWHGAGQRLVS
ncbi:hypothetical protein BCT07_18125 [Vibrio breoganii]|nr:hypothetical protein BCT07_18125 [Vibrio breoganii]